MRKTELKRKTGLSLSADLGLKPMLRPLDVEAVLSPFADSFLPPLHRYPEDQHAVIESRILQEADR